MARTKNKNKPRKQINQRECKYKKRVYSVKPRIIISNIVNSSIENFDISKVNSSSPKVIFKKKTLTPKSDNVTLDEALKFLTGYETEILEKIVNGNDVWVHDSHLTYKIEVTVLSTLKRLQLETEEEESIHTMLIFEEEETAQAVLQRLDSYSHLVGGVKVATITSDVQKSRDRIAEAGVDIVVGSRLAALKVLQEDDEVKEKLKQVKHIITDVQHKNNSEPFRDFLFTTQHEQLVWWVELPRKKDEYFKTMMINPVAFPHENNISRGYGSYFKNFTHCMVKVRPDVKFETLYELLQQQPSLKVMVISNNLNAESIYNALEEHGIKSTFYSYTCNKTGKRKRDFKESARSIPDTTGFKQLDSGVLVTEDPKPFAGEVVDVVINYDVTTRCMDNLVKRYGQLSSIHRVFVIYFVCSEEERQATVESFGFINFGIKVVDLEDMSAVRDYYNGKYMET